MKQGPFLFLGLLLALSLSWLGMVATPQLQLGGQQPTNVPPANVIYPAPHSGEANLGLEVYRANGCAYCHTRVVRQQGTDLHVVVTNPGTNQPAAVNALLQLRPGLSKSDAERLLTSPPTTVLSVKTGAAAAAAEKALGDAGAEVTTRVVPLGPDIERGWGTRLTVGHDYLYDSPLMLGTVRLGPDLTNVGLRRPDANWHLKHLYDPKLEVPGSIMPRYPYLFKTLRRGPQPSREAIAVAGDAEIIPTAKARALVAYLLSLRAEVPLFEAPGPALASSSAPANTAGTATNTGAGVTNSTATNQTGRQ